ncbi:hypothetical protein EVAR_45824_1 [Eumeta japonica]|uniref:Uncharacterized protein n=1 Tax=Eumeta variegata TaxID=151549 RepID=A0A4C1WPC2_EUMVA|nr:hypothetical protein EVAR_45824_1 [Eumeta japonica]
MFGVTKPHRSRRALNNSEQRRRRGRATSAAATCGARDLHRCCTVITLLHLIVILPDVDKLKVMRSVGDRDARKKTMDEFSFSFQQTTFLHVIANLRAKPISLHVYPVREAGYNTRLGFDEDLKR